VTAWTGCMTTAQMYVWVTAWTGCMTTAQMYVWVTAWTGCMTTAQMYVWVTAWTGCMTAQMYVCSLVSSAYLSSVPLRYTACTYSSIVSSTSEKGMSYVYTVSWNFEFFLSPLLAELITDWYLSVWMCAIRLCFKLLLLHFLCQYAKIYGTDFGDFNFKISGEFF